jgi:hypothetical protein
MSVKGGPNTVTSGLVLELDAGNIKSYQSGSTTWFDKSGFANNGTLVNGPTFNTGSNGSIVFDGVNDYVVTPTVNLNSFGLTMNMWFKFQSFSAIRFLLSFSGITPDNTLGIYLTSGNQIILDDRDGPLVPEDISAITSITAISPNTWTNLTATVNRNLGAGNEDTFYINGVPFAVSNTFSGNLNTAYASNPFYIGNVSGSGFPYKGDIALVSIYNRALSAQEVLQNYNALKTRFGL